MVPNGRCGSKINFDGHQQQRYGINDDGDGSYVVGVGGDGIA